MEHLELHRHATAARKNIAVSASTQPSPVFADIANIAILDDSGGVVARRNAFNLDQRTIRFVPVAGSTPRYRFEVSGASYDEVAANLGKALPTLGDDDSAPIASPFPFPYYGHTYTQLFLNSDGNLTFGAADKETSDRTLGRFSAGPPRIAPLFADLDPSRNPQGVRVLSEAGRLVISWAGVPEYQDFGTGVGQTFQVRLFPDGRIEFAYSGISTSGAVVGITPGDLGSNTLVSFASGSIEQYATAIAERFGAREEIDTVTAAQKFYETHEDAYDYLVFYNALGIGASAGAVAWEADVRNFRSGIGSEIVDYGRQYGSASRLQAVMNMGQITQYPTDPNAIVSARALSRDTPLSLLGHEAGHLFLAYASVRDPLNVNARPMLGFQGAHWTFTFNSEASFLEGNRIRDDGPAASPRFLTTATVEGYAPLDQYLMGFRAPSEVPPTFLVTGAGSQFASRTPQPNVSFNGARQDIGVEDIIAAEGRRTPDHTVSQRRFRFAFVLIVPAGSPPRQSDVDQVETYRREFEAFYAKAASGRATSGTTLRLAMRLSSFPASGVLVGRQATATLSIQKPAAAPLVVLLKTGTGAVSVPASVTIAAGATTASFPIAGVRSGVEDLTAEPADSRYDTAAARLPVLASVDGLQVAVISGDRQKAVAGVPLAEPVVVQIRDENLVPYPGIRVQAVASTGGAATPSVAVTDAEGKVSFQWTAGDGQTLTARIEGADTKRVVVTVQGARAVRSLVNAASFGGEIAPGSLVTIFGQNFTSAAPATADLPWPQTLAGVQVFIDRKPASLIFVSSTQINLLAPSDLEAGARDITISVDGNATSFVGVAQVRPAAPGIFFDAATGIGAILIAGTADTTRTNPAAAGDYLEIYATGLGALTADLEVFIQDLPARVLYIGTASGYVGLNQINVQAPEGVTRGLQPLLLRVNGVASNTVRIGVR